MRRSLRLLTTLALFTSVLAFQGGAPVMAAQRPLKCSNKTNHGKTFRYCTGLVRSKDGSVNLDTDVTLPRTGDGPFPVIVMLHGLGGSKGSFESKLKNQPVPTGEDGYDPDSDTVAGTGGRFHFNNLWFASHGYAVLNYTVRGFRDSACIQKDTQSTDADAGLYDPSPACLPQLDSKDHEIKDTQYLIGRLIDRSLISASGVSFRKRKVGVAGLSYGGGHTWLLTRKNTWFSREGRRIKLAAAVPIIGWSDLVDALLPNGVIHPNHVPPASVDERLLEPVGVPKSSYINALFYTMGDATSEPFIRPGYIEAWYERFLYQGEPYADPVAIDALRSFLEKRSARYVSTGEYRTPTYAVQGFNDELFPVVQALAMYNMLKAEDPSWPIRMYAGDWGHPRSQNKMSETKYINNSINAWFNHYLKGAGPAPAAKIEARTTVCGGTAKGDLYRAKSWNGLSNDTTTLSIAGPVELDTAVTDPHAALLDPITEPRNVCRTTNSDVATGNASVMSAMLPSDLTMLGIPTIESQVLSSADHMLIAAHLWDVTADGLNQTLVDRGVFRLGVGGDQAADLRLNGNGYTFAAGHKIKLELTAKDSPTYRASAIDGTISVTGLTLTIPLANPGKLVP